MWVALLRSGWGEGAHATKLVAPQVVAFLGKSMPMGQFLDRQAAVGLPAESR